MKNILIGNGELYLSMAPFRDDLKKYGPFDIIWNLAQELNEYYDDLYKYNFSKLYLFGNIKDYDIPKNLKLFSSQLDKICESLKNGKKVLIHCMGGRGRTGMVYACLLKKLNKVSSEDAIALALKVCKGPETEEQKEFIKNLVT